MYRRGSNPSSYPSTLEPEAIFISALAHYSYCPRRCALIHVESLFDENLFTLKGAQLHERADKPMVRAERGQRVDRALPLWSDRLGLRGFADVVEWPEGKPYPVEYKSGEPKNIRHGSIQLCAQALCLEEMLGLAVDCGALYFFAPKQRIEVLFDENLRTETLTTIQAVRALLDDGQKIPPPVNDRRCPKCSLIDACQPAAVLNARGEDYYRLFAPLPTMELP